LWGYGLRDRSNCIPSAVQSETRSTPTLYVALSLRARKETVLNLHPRVFARSSASPLAEREGYIEEPTAPRAERIIQTEARYDEIFFEEHPKTLEPPGLCSNHAGTQRLGTFDFGTCLCRPSPAADFSAGCGPRVAPSATRAADPPTTGLEVAGLSRVEALMTKFRRSHDNQIPGEARRSPGTASSSTHAASVRDRRSQLPVARRGSFASPAFQGRSPHGRGYATGRKEKIALDDPVLK